MGAGHSDCRKQEYYLALYHPMSAKREIDLKEIVRGHHFTLLCRNGSWDFVETAELAQAEAQVDTMVHELWRAVGSMSAFSSITPREKVILAEIVRGATSKETASRLGISPRTVEFHRANIMSKVGARNAADLVRKVSQT
jgi:DNA-binding CsgD family transcriptional regulator